MGLFDDLDVNGNKLSPKVARNVKPMRLLGAIGDLPLIFNLGYSITASKSLVFCLTFGLLLVL